MRRIILLILLISGDFSDADLCQPVDITYSIGRNQTLLDIDSESISTLPSTCYKQFNIAGALKLKVYIDKLSLSGNKYFTYDDFGIRNVVSFDKVFVSQSKCPKSQMVDNVDWTELTVNGYKMLSALSSMVCFKFTPTNTARNLGGHMKGRGVKIMLAVEVAFCNHTSLPKSQKGDDDQNCLEYCDITGKVKTCPQIVTRDTIHGLRTSSAILQTSTMSSSTTRAVTYIPTHLVSTFPSTGIPTTPSPITITNLKQVSMEFSKPTTSRPYIIYTDVNTRGVASVRHTVVPSITIPSQNTHMSFSTVPVTITASNRAKTYPMLGTIASTSLVHTNELLTSASVYGRSTKSDIDVPATTSQSTSGISSSSGSTSQTVLLNGKKSSVKSEEVFGLVDGLYILIGCLLTITIVVVVSCCIFRKYRVQSHMDHDCQTESSSRAKTVSESYTMPWRDNWLVRHHSSHHHDSLDDEDDVFGLSENDLHFVHGNFVHQSNPELHLIHACQTSLNESTDNISDNNHYLLKLNKGDFDAKVKDVLRKQRLLSITSYDLSKPIQRRRAYTVSESSQDSRQSLDQVVPSENLETGSEKNSKSGRKCQRSSSTMSGNAKRSERVARVAGRRRRTLSQRSHGNIKEENSAVPPETNDLNKDANELSCSSIEEATDKPARHNILVQDSMKRSASSDSQSSQTTDNETKSETFTKDKTLKNVQNGDSTVLTINPGYPPSCRYGASGTMQFKK